MKSSIDGGLLIAMLDCWRIPIDLGGRWPLPLFSGGTIVELFTCRCLFVAPVALLCLHFVFGVPCFHSQHSLYKVGAQ